MGCSYSCSTFLGARNNPVMQSFTVRAALREPQVSAKGALAKPSNIFEGDGNDQLARIAS
jgi:hypothetical protein